MAESVKIACRGSATIAVSKLVDFQGNLKSLTKENYERLKRQILKLGFSEPISVWKSGNKHFILNGHQRVRTLQMMATEGYEVPDVPVNMVDAKDRDEAKRKLLALTSQYGEFDRQGLYEFITDAGIQPNDLLEDFRLPEVDVTSFISEFYEPAKQELGEELDESLADDVKMSKCPNCGHEFAK